MASAALSSAASGAAAGSAFGPWGTAIGAGVGLLGGLLNKKKSPKAVQIDPYDETDVAEQQRLALDANLANAGDIEGLLARANTFNQGQANSLMEQAIPGWGNLQRKFLQTADNLLTNPYEVPKEVESNLARLAAERGISSGARGQFSQFSLLRDFGVNQLQYGQQRMSQGENLLSLVGSLSPRVSPLSPLSFYVTPQQATSVAQANAAGKSQVAMGNAGVLGKANSDATAAANWNSENMWKTISGFVAAASQPGFIPPSGGK